MQQNAVLVILALEINDVLVTRLKN